LNKHSDKEGEKVKEANATKEDEHKKLVNINQKQKISLE